MLTELLIIYTCAVNQGCEQTRAAYLTQNPQIQERLGVYQRKAQAIVPTYAGSVIAIAYRREFTLPINKNITVGYKVEDSYTLRMAYGFDY